MTKHHESAREPEELTRLFIERARERDAEGVAALYEPDAVMAYPAGQVTVGREAIRAVFEKLFASPPPLMEQEVLPTLRCGDLALTAARMGGKDARSQVARRQPDGSWLRILDRPSFLDQ